jgi:hypothetical protein
MRNWRGKLITALVIYFAGFATAIYFLAPVTETADKAKQVTSSRESNSETQQFAMAFNGKMKQALSFAEEKAVEIGQVIKTELAERQLDK